MAADLSSATLAPVRSTDRWTNFSSPALPWQDVLEAAPGNALAIRLIADILEAASDPHAVEVRQRAVVAAPDDPLQRYALIHTALQFGDLPLAQRTLADMPAFSAASRDHAIATAAVAFVAGYPGSADDLLRSEFPRAADAPVLRMWQSVLRLRHGRPADKPVVRQELRALRIDRPADSDLWLDIISDALRNSDDTVALQISNQAAGRPEAPFPDHLRRANVWLLYRQQQFGPACAGLERQAIRAPRSVAWFANWLIARGRADAAGEWLDTLPDSLRGTPEARSARADCFAALRDWEQALPLIEAGAWGEIASLPVRRAIAGGQLGSSSQPSNWDRALRDAADDLGTLRVLYRLALTWKLPRQQRAILFAIGRLHPTQGWALQLLADQFLQEKRAEPLRSLYELWHQGDPENLTVEIRFLMLTLLTTRKVNLRIRETIENRSRNHTGNPEVETLRAFSLWLQDRPKEALQVTENILSLNRRYAQRALYHGLFVATAGGRSEEAEIYLSLSEKAQLLPEETQLIRTARSLMARNDARR